STMVRLTAFTSVIRSASEKHFNSTMVRLTVHIDICACTLLLFQFHYGAINRSITFISPSFVSIFQFHYGAINSVVPPCDSNSLLNFNSTMVRLTVSVGSVGGFTSKFQFHYGAINSPKVLHC